MAAPVILLDDEHRYSVDGKRVPGVTEIILSQVRPDDYARWFTQEARLRGKAVHAAVQFHLEGDLDWSSVDERIRGYVGAAIAFITDTRFKPELVEKPVCHAIPPFAGTPDLIGLAFGVDETVVDWKSGVIDEGTALQTAAYDLAYGGSKHRRRMGVALGADGRYRKEDFTDRRDYGYFLSAASLYNRYRFKGAKRAAAA